MFVRGGLSIGEWNTSGGHDACSTRTGAMEKMSVGNRPAGKFTMPENGQSPRGPEFDAEVTGVSA